MKTFNWLFITLGLIAGLTSATYNKADAEEVFDDEEMQLEESVVDDLIPKDKIPPYPIFPLKSVDLTVTNVSAPVRVGNVFQVHVTIRNNGRLAANSFYTLVRDNYGYFSKSVLTPTLAGGQSSTFSLYLSPGDDPTTCYISAIVDYGNKVSESNEKNNSGHYLGQWNF